MPRTLRAALAEESQRAGLSMSRFLERIVSEWLRRADLDPDRDADEQERLRIALLASCGTLSLDPGLGTNASRRVRASIESRRSAR